MSIFEDRFPGNASVMDRLLAALRSESVTAFTGAGTSMPALPSWTRLIADLINDAEKDGRLDTRTAAALRGEKTDILYVADEIYSAAGASQTKSKVARVFSSLQEATEAHSLISATNFQRLITLNYDSGLEVAFATRRSSYVQGILPNQSNELDSWIRRTSTGEISPILHWHGIASDAQSIILSGSDYTEFYDANTNNRETIRKIFSTNKLLLIGFGFSDPFITHELSSIMQPIRSSDSHFAVIGVDDQEPFNLQLERRRYSSKYKVEVVFYPVKLLDRFPDHSALLEILRYVADQCPRPEGKPTAIASVTAVPVDDDPPTSYRSSLFTIGDRQIYCEPNIFLMEAADDRGEERSVRIEEVIADNGHCTIYSTHEFGLSNLGRRLAAEIKVAGVRTMFREAGSMPKYRKAMLADRDLGQFELNERFTVILDNFSAFDHQRTAREISSVFKNARLIMLQKGDYASSADEQVASVNYKTYGLRGFTRSNIRSVINAIAPTFNTDDTSVIVDKVYSDLVQLCIPLTPSNVIMYASVLCRDGSFSPVSRLHIVERFVSEALRRASDAYADTFNSTHKIDLLSAFCFSLFERDAPYFNHSEWVSYCEDYKKTNLVEFNSAEIMADLINGRVVAREGRVFNFRYRMFYSYFVGRHLASNLALMPEILSCNRHLEIDGLLEVLCGTLPDCSMVLNDLTERLNTSLSSFYVDYPIGGLDLHAGVRWESRKEEEVLWAAVSGRLNNGPASTHELDELKTSIHAERRTDDQKVSIIKFIASEQNVANYTNALIKALESVKQASADSKRSAAMAVIDGVILAYEVASIFVPLIAEKKYVAWNGFAYLNLIEDKREASDNLDAAANRDRKQNLVAHALPGSIGDNAADQFGSRKLGQVFLSLSAKMLSYPEIKQFLLFTLLLRSKPSGWLDRAKSHVAAVGRHDIYLRHMLMLALRQFRDQINTDAERLQLKELVAAIALRRDVNVKFANKAQIVKAIGKLEQDGFWGNASTG